MELKRTNHRKITMDTTSGPVELDQERDRIRCRADTVSRLGYDSFVDPSSKRMYYAHRETGETTWERPRRSTKAAGAAGEGDGKKLLQSSRTSDEPLGSNRSMRPLKSVSMVSIKTILRNWVLIALTVFALLGLVIAVILYAAPCDDRLVLNQRILFENLEIIPSVQSSNCRASTESQTIAKAAICKDGYTLENQTICEKVSCKTALGDTTTETKDCLQTCADQKCLLSTIRPEDGAVLCDKFLTQCTQYLTQNCLTKTVCKKKGSRILEPLCPNITTYGDFDALLLLDYSGSMGKSVGTGNYFQRAVNITISNIISRFDHKLGGDSLEMGAVAWSNDIQTDKQFQLNKNITALVQTLTSWKTDSPSGLTYFASPLAWCANQVHASNRANDRYKVCILMTDGENQDSTNKCTSTECNKFCSRNSISDCTLEKIINKMRKELNIVIAGVFMDIGSSDTLTPSKKLYCRTSCNQQATIQACDADNTVTQTSLNTCSKFLSGSLNQLSALEANLDAMVDSISSEVNVTSESTSAQLARKALASSRNQTAIPVPDGNILEGCQDPTHFFLLLFFLPLAVYILWYPCKRRIDARKDRLRGLLRARKRLLRQSVLVGNKLETTEEVEEEEEEQSVSARTEETGKYKWKIAANEHYLWSSHTHGGILKVDFGKNKAPPPSAPQHHNKNNKILLHSDGTIVKEEDIAAALAEIESATTVEDKQKIQDDLEIAMKMEEAGELKEDGLFWLRLCSCCRNKVDIDEDDDESYGDEDHDLPGGWSSALDASSGNTYYCNEDGTTTWDKPRDNSIILQNNPSFRNHR